MSRIKIDVKVKLTVQLLPGQTQEDIFDLIEDIPYDSKYDEQSRVLSFWYDYTTYGTESYGSVYTPWGPHKEYYVHDIEYKELNIDKSQIIKIEEHEIL